MPFEMSEKGVFEEEIMYAMCFYENFIKDGERIIEGIHQNQELDLLNDRVRGEVTRHILAAISCNGMTDYAEANKHDHAALQRLHAQETIDFKDDKPRTDALIKLSNSLYRAKMNYERLKKHLIKLNGDRKNEPESSLPKP